MAQQQAVVVRVADLRPDQVERIIYRAAVKAVMMGGLALAVLLGTLQLVLMALTQR
jgi:hypothetical protein